MTRPEVDQELERLFAVVREATQPDAGARERVRAGLAASVATGAAPRRGWGWRAWLGIGVAVLGVGAVALGLRGTEPAQRVAAATPTAAFVASATAPASPPVVAPAAPEVAEAPLLAPAAPTTASASATAGKPSAPTRSADASADPAEELALVRSMQQALRAGNADQALALAAQHARRFPRGNLVEEREGVRAIAQCRLAAPPAREKIWAAFAQRFASSPYAARVKAACQ